MRKLLYVLLWISCIVLLSFAYEGYLYSEFALESVQGVVEDKGVAKTVKNTYGNFTEEVEYWIQLNGEKIVVNKVVFDKVNGKKEIRVNRTKHGVVIE
jgi:hypothetical protein